MLPVRARKKVSMTSYATIHRTVHDTYKEATLERRQIPEAFF